MLPSNEAPQNKRSTVTGHIFYSQVNFNEMFPLLFVNILLTCVCIVCQGSASSAHQMCYFPTKFMIHMRYIYKETYIICLSFEIDKSYIKHYLKRLCFLFFLQKHMAGRGAAAIYPSNHAHYTTGGDATDLCKCCFFYVHSVGESIVYLCFLCLCIFV